MAKRTKKDENKIVLWVILFSFLIITLLVTSFLFIKPQIEEIEELKKVTKENFDKLELAKKEWLSFEDFKRIAQEKSSELFTSYQNESIMKEINEEFFNSKIKNSSQTKLYEDFIKSEIEKYKKSTTNEEKLQLTSKILPYYSESITENSYLTDFQFINYVESLLYSFNLSYNNSIWIDNIEQLENYTLLNTDTSLEKWIYKISLELDVSWRKSNIIDFLHYIENVWNVTLNEENWEISINRGTSLTWVFSNFSTKKLESDKNKKISEYNIFNNQIIDVESIYMDSYIDSSETVVTITENPETFLEYLKTTQEREKFTVKIKLNFFVKGLPKYKFEEIEKNFTTKLTKLIKNVTEKSSKTNISSSQRQKLQTIKTSLTNIQWAIKNAEKTNDVLSRFQNISWYIELLNEYEAEINRIN